MNRSGAHSTGSTNVRLLAALYGAELSIALALVSLLKKNETSWSDFLSTTAGIYFAGSIVVVLVLGLAIFQQFKKSKRDGSNQFAVAVALNLMVVIPTLLAAEVGVRILSTDTPSGPQFLNAQLLPRDWQAESQFYLDMLATGRTRKLTIFETDNLLGWTIAPNSKDEGGLYFNSAEGIRSDRTGVSRTTVRTANRIALVGNSYTYAQDVDYESSWGRQIEKTLGEETQVLNFGVPGFGVDQAFLRYQRDVTPLKPEVVVFALIPDDLMRSMTVYSFIRFPQWESPYSTPRFVAEGDGIRLINTPLLDPVTIFSKESVHDLPFLEYEPGYHRSEWQWRFYHHSYIGRLLSTRFRTWPEPSGKTGAESQTSINMAILRSFIDSASGSGAVPIIVYLPAPSDFGADPADGARGLLQRAGVPFLDATPRLSKLDPSERFVDLDGRRGHFTPKANRALADLVSCRITRDSELGGLNGQGCAL